jgi:hypothetical protein
MRTTINIDATVLERARQRAVAEQRSVGAVVSEWARLGVRLEALERAAGAPEESVD